MFIRQDNKENAYRVVDSKSTAVVDNVEAGLYNLNVHRSMFGTSVSIERNERYKDSEPITSGIYGEVLKSIDKFISKDMYDIRKEMGMMHKIGMIFNGNIGTGKTFLAGQIAEKLAKEKDALSIIVKGEPDVPLQDLVDTLRMESPDRLIVFILDEYEKNNYGNESMLHFLDGKDSRDNVIVIATVNSTRSIPNEIKNRKGRIEYIFNFTVKSRDVVARIIDNVLPKKYTKYINKEELINQAMKNDALLKIDNLTIRIRDLIYEGIRKEMNKPKVAKAKTTKQQ